MKVELAKNAWGRATHHEDWSPETPVEPRYLHFQNSSHCSTALPSTPTSQQRRIPSAVRQASSGPSPATGNELGSVFAPQLFCLIKWRSVGRARNARVWPSTQVIPMQEPWSPLGEVLCGPGYSSSSWQGGGRGECGNEHGEEGYPGQLFFQCQMGNCGISKYISKWDILEGERRTGENKIVCFAKGIFKWLDFS